MKQYSNQELKELINTPLVLITLPKEVIEQVNEFLPYSTGFEIECNKLSTFKDENFRIIPNILDVNCDSYEQRFRIPNGVAGFICLYNICEQLRLNSELNMGSGIHYHIDFTDCFVNLTTSFLEANSEWILNELDSWNYQGIYNKRNVSQYSHTWMRTNDLGTIEFRLGEMSFDYKVLVERIIHCNSIAKRLKDLLKVGTVPQYQQLDKPAILEQLKRNKVKDKTLQKLQEKLASYQFDKEKGNTYDESLMEYTINNRIVKI